jgi:hypothetical protein
MTPKKFNVAVCVDGELRQKVIDAADAEDLSVSQVIRRALRHELTELDRISKVGRDGKRRAAKRAQRRTAALA